MTYPESVPFRLESLAQRQALATSQGDRIMFHKTIIVGNLGKTPELRKTKSEISVTSFPVAVNESWTDAQGERQEKTTWYKVTCWRSLADTCAKYLTKGRQVLVEGTMQAPDTWLDKEGNPRAELNLTAYTVKFVGSRSDGEAPSSTELASAADGALPKAESEPPFVETGDEYAEIPF